MKILRNKDMLTKVLVLPSVKVRVPRVTSPAGTVNTQADAKERCAPSSDHIELRVEVAAKL